MKGLTFIIICLFLCPTLLSAQRISYTQPDQEDSRNTNFDIIGKVGGNVLIFNAHLSSQDDRPIEFPSQESELPDPEALILFKMSSILPPKLRDAAKSEGFRVNENTRGFVFNADLVSVVRFLDIGTRAVQTVR